MVFCCSLNAIHPHSRQLFSLKILVARRSLRSLLYAAPLILLVTCYSLLPLTCLLPDYCLVFVSLQLDQVGPLLFRCSPIAVHRSLDQWLFPAGSSRLRFHFFLFRLVARPIAVRSSWLVSSGLLRVTHFFIFASLLLNVGCSPFSTTLAS